MKLKLEEKDNKKFVSLFPSVLDEAERNIKTLESINIETIVSNEDEKRLVKANKLLDCLLNGIITEEEYASKSEAIKAEPRRLKIEQG